MDVFGVKWTKSAEKDLHTVDIDRILYKRRDWKNIL